MLEKLSSMCDVNVVIISGRSVENVKKMVGIQGITYAGNHGFEIEHPDGTLFIHPVPHEYLLLQKQLKAELEKISTDGAWVEDKGSSLTFHFREVTFLPVA